MQHHSRHRLSSCRLIVFQTVSLRWPLPIQGLSCVSADPVRGGRLASLLETPSRFGGMLLTASLHLGVVAGLFATWQVAHVGGQSPTLEVALLPTASADSGAAAAARQVAPVPAPTLLPVRMAPPAEPSITVTSDAAQNAAPLPMPDAGTESAANQPTSQGAPGPAAAVDRHDGLVAADGATGKTPATGAGRGAADPYAATVLAWIEKHKAYPRDVAGRQIEGVVLIAFTLDRRGRVLDVRLRAGSGAPALDLVAMRQLKAASPFPPPPHGTRWRVRQFEVPLAFHIRRPATAG